MLTDTKAKRLVVIVLLAVVVLGAAAYFTNHGRSLADDMADRLERDARELTAGTTYEEAVELRLEELVLNGVEPQVVDDAIPGELVVLWEIQKWGARRCVSARWVAHEVPAVTRRDC